MTDRQAAVAERLLERESPRPELRSSAAEGIAREGMVTVWDEHGRYLGYMGIATWEHLLREAARAE